MTKENQQNGRLIQQRKQDSPGFRAVLPQHRGHLRFLRIRLLRIQNRQRHPPLPAPQEAGGNSLATAFPLPSLHRPRWTSSNSTLKGDAVMFPVGPSILSGEGFDDRLSRITAFVACLVDPLRSWKFSA
jgi:hypothetical protein